MFYLVELFPKGSKQESHTIKLARIPGKGEKIMTEKWGLVEVKDVIFRAFSTDTSNSRLFCDTVAKIQIHPTFENVSFNNDE